MPRRRSTPDRTALTPVPRPIPSEAASLGREMSRAYLQGMRFLRTQLALTLDEAHAEWRQLLAYDHQLLEEAPAASISWGGLGRLTEEDAAQGAAVWARIEAEARDELASGHRTAAVLECGAEPWERAQFLALRQAFRDAWPPRGGVEETLIDVLAQTHSAYLTWLHTLQVRTTLDVQRTSRTTYQHRQWEPQRLEEAAAVEQAAAMVDRFNKLFLRTLRSLRDLRRYGPVIVQNPAQVNIGTQQVNTVQQHEADRSIAGAVASVPPLRQRPRGAKGMTG